MNTFIDIGGIFVELDRVMAVIARGELSLVLLSCGAAVKDVVSEWPACDVVAVLENAIRQRDEQYAALRREAKEDQRQIMASQVQAIKAAIRPDGESWKESD